MGENSKLREIIPTTPKTAIAKDDEEGEDGKKMFV